MDEEKGDGASKGFGVSAHGILAPGRESHHQELPLVSWVETKSSVAANTGAAKQLGRSACFIIQNPEERNLCATYVELSALSVSGTSVRALGSRKRDETGNRENAE